MTSERQTVQILCEMFMAVWPDRKIFVQYFDLMTAPSAAGGMDFPTYQIVVGSSREHPLNRYRLVLYYCPDNNTIRIFEEPLLNEWTCCEFNDETVEKLRNL
jgi:hypothetical protein